MAGWRSLNGRYEPLGIKVVYTTGLPVTDGMHELLVEGSSLLPKPYTVPQLTEAVDALLQGTQ